MTLKKRGESKRLKAKEGRREERGVRRMLSPLTAGGPTFCPSNTASSWQLSSGIWTVGEDVNSGESRGWPLPWTGMGKKENTCHPRARTGDDIVCIVVVACL